VVHWVLQLRLIAPVAITATNLGCSSSPSLETASNQPQAESETLIERVASDAAHFRSAVPVEHVPVRAPVEVPLAGRLAAADTPVTPSAAGAAAPELADAGVMRELDWPTPGTRPRPPLLLPSFATVEIEDGTSLPQIGHGDLWPSCWSDDDALYVAAGDGRGFGLIQRDIAVGVINGRPGEPDYRGTQLAVSSAVSDIWNGADYNRKPTGMLCLDGDLYIAIQDLRRETFADAPAATIARSQDKGRTWTWDRTAPMFTDHVWTTIMFLDYGKDSEHAPSDFVYAYGLDDNWAFSEGQPGPTSMFLARIPRGQVQERSAWEFFAGIALGGEPHFSPDITARVPVLEDKRRLHAAPLDPQLRFQDMTAINQGGVVYNAPLGRYLFSTWTEYTFELYEAPTPWGPFHLFSSKDFGVWPWNDARNGGYATTIPSKFISEDGKHMLLQANSWVDVTGKDNYSFSLRSLRVEPYRVSFPSNLPAPANLATPEHGAVRTVRAARQGRPQIMNDGDTATNDEDSHNGEAKQYDYWGYTWPKSLYLNTLRYTTGKQLPTGGYFEQLGLQVRHESEWIDVPWFDVQPAYPGTAETTPFTTYTLRFSPVIGNGIRIHGQPGGTEHYTSIAELSAHFE
jgi:hypothetical protein